MSEITGERLDRILVDLGQRDIITVEEAKALMLGLAWLEGTMINSPATRAVVQDQGVTMEVVSKLLRS